MSDEVCPAAFCKKSIFTVYPQQGRPTEIFCGDIVPRGWEKFLDFHSYDLVIQKSVWIYEKTGNRWCCCKPHSEYYK